ncbi:hypothetical protein VTN00DRAFT_4228 [Thermoascus crustaceus]|uniref:uncharacterized protein n=1 Tax=Thermoascus crustaceus TaxID=5088 RepID=UPI0037430160
MRTDFALGLRRITCFDAGRGPWRDQREYVCSIGIRELEWTRQFGKPQVNDFPHNNIVKGEVSPETYMDLLEKYLSTSPYILPEGRGNPLNKPTLHHPDLNQLVAHWDHLAAEAGKSEKIKCPVQFDADDVEEFYRIEENWFKATILLEYWRSLLDDLGQDRWVRNESYEKVVEINRQLKKEWLDEAEDEEDGISVERYWPFQDHELVD